jgi:formylglycine-generating enzyme required for sulfatase activity
MFSDFMKIPLNDELKGWPGQGPPGHIKVGEAWFVQLDPNRPAERYARDYQAILDFLNANDPKWSYRWPTKVEWEYAMRAGSSTKYFYGDRFEDINFYGWNHFNSSRKTMPVAKLLPNPFGLHDVYGNVSEIVTNHDGTSTACGGNFTSRGPSFFGRLGYFSVNPNVANCTHGFRLVRTPK